MVQGGGFFTRPWGQQPQEAAAINWANPVTQSLRVFVTPNAGALRELVQGVFPATNSSTRRVSRAIGADYVNQQTTFTHAGGYDVTSDLTIVVITDVDTLTNYSALVSKNALPGTFVPYELRIGLGATDSNIDIVRGNAVGVRQWKASNSNLIAAGSKNNFIAVTQAGVIEAAPLFYVNGTKYTGIAVSGGETGAASTNSGPLYIGKRGDGVTHLDGAIYLVAVWARVLSDAEIASVYREPWQLFAPCVQRIWAPAASGGAYTVTASAGSYSVTGQPATIARSRILSAAAGSYALTGQPATIARNRALLAANGSYLVSGQPATILRSNRITANAGAYSLTGQAATLTYVGSGANYPLSAAAGSYSLAGQAATIRRTRILTAAAVTYAVAGRAAAIAYSGAPAPSGGVYFDVLSGRLLVLRART